MRSTWLWLTFAACYAPSTPSNVPCANGMRCPSGQTCVMNTCVVGGGDVDAAIDGAVDARPDGPPNDVDGDGVPNADDLCPNTPDPKQYNEDGDALGDVCDPCPISSNNADADADGVGDDCDPNPAIGGDTIVLFEGFNDGVPAGWTAQGNWTPQNGAVGITVNPGQDATLDPPTMIDASNAVSAAFIPMTAPNDNAGFGVAQRAGNEGVLCALIVVGGTRVLGQIDLDVDDFLSEEPYAWANQTTYITGQLRIGNQFGCVSVDPMGMVREVNASTNEVPSQSRLQYRTRGVSGQLLWMLAVDSP